ncbi:MAG: hypothetical protein CMP14_10645 [Rickettsiales bacterium]|nr:hypothetical protein [Rickettsiales bacterium]
MSTEHIAQIIEFWLGESQTSPEAAAGRRDLWYRGGTPVDIEIGQRFGNLVAEACNGSFSEWRASPEGCLASILLLDQFTRNLYRNTADAYLGDAVAFEVTVTAIEKGLDRMLHPVSRIWLYHPFHHSEQVAHQDRGIGLLHGTICDAPLEWHPYIKKSISGWTRHRDIVARFGRFPHRNEVLGRVSTEEELEFLSSSGESFGQGPVRVGDRKV